ncbi:hypothetical protein MCP1_290028 [Candidatus Terasakiella magnetica]|nr:hypothetical protein MCP1_290028 [Candidatus Terasakiella magnetica]
MSCRLFRSVAGGSMQHECNTRRLPCCQCVAAFYEWTGSPRKEIPSVAPVVKGVEAKWDRNRVRVPPFREPIKRGGSGSELRSLRNPHPGGPERKMYGVNVAQAAD